MAFTLTQAECLLLERRRRGESQTRAARRYRIPVSRYVAWERGTREITKPVSEIVPTPCEKCVVLRKRSGKAQKEIAAEMRRSRMWVVLMERGDANPTELLRYWNEHS